MRASPRRLDPSLIEQLIATPWAFEFFEAVRLADRSLRDGSDHGALSERISFANTLRLDFPPSEIETIRPQTCASAPDQAPVLKGIEIVTSFMGLLGRHGVLPLHYTESIVEHERLRRSTAPRAFFDLLTNRSLAQFYLAWRKYKLHFQFERDRRKHFVPLVRCLCGLGQKGLQDRLARAEGAVDDEALVCFAALLRQRPVSAYALATILGTYLGVAVRLEQFVGAWYVVPGRQRTVLGLGNAVLGQNALLGERVWQCDLRIRICLGPLNETEYLGFLPGSDRAAALRKLLELIVGSSFELQVRPILRAADVPACALTSSRPRRLGFDSFLSSRPAVGDHLGTVYAVGFSA